MIALLVVSHSRPLARAAVDLAAQMVPEDRRPAIKVAAGLDEDTLGTDASAVSAALEELSDAEGVLVLVDLGSAILSAEMALEFVDPDLAARVRISAAPIVEGLVAAVVTASSGAPLDEVDREARASLTAKIQQVDADQPQDGQAPDDQPQDGQQSSPVGDSQAVPPVPSQPQEPDEQWELVLDNPHGLHARPAAALVSALRGLDAQVSVANASTGSTPVDAQSLSAVTGLQLRQGQTMRLSATGPQAREARGAVTELAARHFGDEIAQPAAKEPSDTGPVRGPARIISLDPDISGYRPGDPQAEQRRLDESLRSVEEYLRAAASGPLSAVFTAQSEMLADPVLARKSSRRVQAGDSALGAVMSVLGDMAAGFDKLTDPYLRERGQDVRSLRRLLVLALTAADWTTGLDVQKGIWVLPELDAITAASLDTDRCTGIITTTGGDTGHGAMIARSRGIPLLLGVPDAAKLTDGEQVEIDPAGHTLRRLQDD